MRGGHATNTPSRRSFRSCEDYVPSSQVGRSCGLTASRALECMREYPQICHAFRADTRDAPHRGREDAV